MKSIFLFLVIFTFCLNRAISFRPYFAENDENDPIDECKNKKLIEDDQSVDDDLISNIKNDLTDYDYNNGNYDSNTESREPEIKEYNKRETKTVGDIRSFSDADLKLAMSRLSDEELQILEKLMEIEVEASKMEKREIQQKKRCSSKYGCADDDIDEPEDDEHYKKVFANEHLREKNAHKARRYNRFKRFNRFGPLTREEILQARIDFLKDNYKRQSEIGKIENSFKAKETRFKRDTARNVIRNPYFNSSIGPRSRTKRALSDKLNVTKTANPMDDPKSDEHIKLLEDSFPNPNPENSLDLDQSHIRVKRG